MIDTNLTGTANLLHACADIDFEAFINAGSSSEYGLKDHAPDEDELAEPNSYYASTKLSATQFAKFLGTMRELPVCTLRLYSAYGPYESPERFIPNLVVRGFDGKLPPLVHPATARDYIYVEDICDAFLSAAASAGKHPGAVWNVGSGAQTSIAEVVSLARTMLGIIEEPGFGTMKGRDWDTNVWIADCKRIHRDLGWSPKHNLEQGLSQTIAWFRKNDQMLEYYRKHLSVSLEQ
jgi:dolichol-phosphate mannosyltransferase